MSDNKFNTQDGHDQYRANYRDIFGRSKSNINGHQFWVNGVWVDKLPERKHIHTPVVKIRALDYTVDKVRDKQTMKRTVEICKRYRHVGCPEQYG